MQDELKTAIIKYTLAQAVVNFSQMKFTESILAYGLHDSLSEEDGMNLARRYLTELEADVAQITSSLEPGIERLGEQILSEIDKLSDEVANKMLEKVRSVILNG